LSLNIQQCEDLWLEIEIKNFKIILAVIYCHPSKEILTFQDKFCEILSDLNAQKLNYIIGGDININYLIENNSKIIDYINSLSAIDVT